MTPREEFLFRSDSRAAAEAAGLRFHGALAECELIDRVRALAPEVAKALLLEWVTINGINICGRQWRVSPEMKHSAIHINKLLEVLLRTAQEDIAKIEAAPALPDEELSTKGHE